MLNSLIIILGKILSFFVKQLNLGNGSTWPGHLALNINKNFIRDILKLSTTKVIVVAGTNGKTTTTKILATIFEKQGKTVLHNTSGANLLNGIASAILLHSSLSGKLKADYAVFEVDENALTNTLKEVNPNYLVILNLFRDQLDRYGEVNTIALNWRKAISLLPKETILVLNADDPTVATLDQSTEESILHKVYYFGCKIDQNELKENAIKHQAVDSVYCTRCGNKLDFKTIYFSHLGNWQCPKCKLYRPNIDLDKSPIYPLSGLYNTYNTNAAVLIAHLENISDPEISTSLKDFKPAFGRQEEINIDNKKVRIYLSKNPTGFNESLRTIKKLGAKNILFVLNDRIPDGKDVSWIWDTDLENLLEGNEKLSVSGDRVYDMGLRLKYLTQNDKKGNNLNYLSSSLKIYEQVNVAIEENLRELTGNEILYIIPTYSAMLEVRKILTGKKIL